MGRELVQKLHLVRLNLKKNPPPRMCTCVVSKLFTSNIINIVISTESSLQ